MAGTWNRGNPTGFQVKNMGPMGTGIGTITATGTLFAGLISVRVPLAVSSTGAYWSNPEDGTVMAKGQVVWTTAGTGTMDVGVSTDGTSGAANIIDGGTMLVGVYSYGTVMGTAAASATLGQTVGEYRLVGPAGTGTNNTITVIHNESTTGTAVGFLFVQYMRVQ